MRRLVDVRVAITAIEPELAGVQIVAEGHRLHRRVADARVLRRHVVRDARRRETREYDEINDDLERKLVRRLREDVRHGRGIRRRKLAYSESARRATVRGTER